MFQELSAPTLFKPKELLKKCGDIYLVNAYWNWQWSRALDTSPLEGKLD